MLVLFGLFCGFLICEVVLRIRRPDLRNVVDSKFQKHSYRIHANPKNDVYTRVHPDTQEEYVTIHNSLGFRQHREFNPQKTKETFRIGFFGDSFTENLRMQVQYSFTEPVNYLLSESGVVAEVLNFGTDGYGTDQVYLQYIDEGAKLDLDFVFYVYCHNDLKDILANHLFETSPTGELRYLPRRKKYEFLIDVIKNFYLTYFIIEKSKGLQYALSNPYYEHDTIVNKWQEVENRKQFSELSITKPSEELETSVNLFRKILSKIRDETKKHNQKFVVILLPRFEEANLKIAEVLNELEIETLDLLPLFKGEEQNLSEFFFKKDGHWNEEGNKIAAVHIFKYLEQHLKLTSSGDDFIRSRLYSYYNSFQPMQVSPSWLEAGSSTKQSQEAEAIRSKYLELELK